MALLRGGGEGGGVGEDRKDEEEGGKYRDGRGNMEVKGGGKKEEGRKGGD